ncbi:MAG TPA: protein kinase [Vicinamibacterales bacterium]|nr:protein kinase [Vicinamibacterales bacterium]
MPLSRGSVLGQYEIAAFLGEGGMGTVYRARDRKLKRDVAIKVLPDEFAADPDRLARFQREAEALAALNHTNIGAIYDLQEAGDTTFLVLELVDGETLDDLIRKSGRLSIREAIDRSLQICAALEAAHDKGIVHRDLKPANIKIAPDGTLKLLDFGLATMRQRRASHDHTHSITQLDAAADRSVSGTPEYMAPEQLRAEPVDRRVDVWAFGCVLYQMLTGAAPFRGATIAETFGLIVGGEPDWSRLGAGAPAGLRALLRQCLRKERKHRLAYIADVRVWLEDLVAHPEADDAAAVAPAPGPGARFWWAGWAAALVAAAGAAFVLSRRTPAAGVPEARVQVVTPTGSDPVEFALSPDGRRLVFPATARGKTQLWVRPLDSFTAQPIAGTDGASFPFWSPGGDAVAFFADGQLKRIELPGGVPVTLAKAPLGRGGTWSASGTIVFAPSGTGPLFKVAATSGDAVSLTTLEPAHMSHRFPQFLRDGEHFIFFAAGQSPGVYLGSIAGGAPRRLVATDLAGVITPSGYLLYLHEGTVFAQRFDERALALTGEPAPVAEQLAVDSGAFVGAMTAAGDSVAYRPAGAGRRQLNWYDRTGKMIESTGAPDAGVLTGAEISPDGRHVAVNRMLNGNLDVWLVELSKGSLTRVTFQAPLDAWPHWTDGTHILFSSNVKGTYNLYEKGAAGGPDRLVLETPQAKIPQDVSPDGRTVLFASLDPQTGFDLWTAPMNGGEPPRVFLKTPFQESGGQFSPDGKWIAYYSNESGQYEVYVQPVDGGQDRRIQVSTGGGAQPRWRHDGRELFFVSLDSNMMAAGVKPSPNGAIDIATPVALFPVNIVGGPILLNNTQQYGVSPDGQRFLVNVPIDTIPPINLLEHWKPGP